MVSVWKTSWNPDHAGAGLGRLAHGSSHRVEHAPEHHQRQHGRAWLPRRSPPPRRPPPSRARCRWARRATGVRPPRARGTPPRAGRRPTPRPGAGAPSPAGGPSPRTACGSRRSDVGMVEPREQHARGFGPPSGVVGGAHGEQQHGAQAEHTRGDLGRQRSARRPRALPPQERPRGPWPRAAIHVAAV